MYARVSGTCIMHAGTDTHYKHADAFSQSVNRSVPRMLFVQHATCVLHQGPGDVKARVVLNLFTLHVHVSPVSPTFANIMIAG
jgi:hypothetical protein